jgi:hypothetical protein
MKKIILISSFIPVFGFAQMTESTDPATGTSSSLYLCDSNAIRYENVVGTGVIWDYSNILGVDTDGNGTAESRTLSISIPDNSTLDSLFPGATKKFSINNQIITYYSTSVSERVSQGFKFTEPSLGDVFTFWDTIPQILNTYPFNLGSTSVSQMSGRIFSDNPTAAVDTFAVGNCYSSIDGVGTLKLGATDYPNTFRYRFLDTINSYVNINFAGTIINAPVVLYRDVYEYYNYATSPLPIFVIYEVDNSFFNNPNTIVLSRELPSQNIGVNELGFANEIKVYPNPSNDVFNVELPAGSSAKLLDAFGKKVIDIIGSQIDLSKNASGVYFLEVSKGNQKSVKRLTKL